MNPPLNFVECVYKRISIEAIDQIEEDEKKPEIELEPINFDISVEHLQNNKEPRLFKIVMDVDTEENPEYYTPYKIGITSVGFFKIGDDVPEDKWSMLVSVLAPSMLYGATRDFVYTITSRCPNQGLFLPTTSFVRDEETNSFEEESNNLPTGPQP